MRSVSAFLCLLLVAPFAFSPPAPPQQFFLGFDRNYYPGDDAMKLLRKDFVFTSYWLTNPPQTKSNSWSGKREFLHSLGYGFLPLVTARESSQFKTKEAAWDFGKQDAQENAVIAEREGFSKGTIIFLDIEEGGRLSDLYLTYIQSWLWEITALGFRGGFYCSGIPVAEGGDKSITTADNIFEFLWKKSRGFAVWVFNDSCPPSPGCTTPQALPSPAKSGIDYAYVWQFVRSPRDKDTARLCRGYAKDGNCYAAFDTAHKYNLDLNVATSADPSTGPGF